jgi:hypothetical protein
MGEVRHVRLDGLSAWMRPSDTFFWLAVLGCPRERTLRRLLGLFGTPAIEESSDDRDLGRPPANRRSAKSQAVAYSRVQACGRLRYHSVTAKQSRCTIASRSATRTLPDGQISPLPVHPHSEKYSASRLIQINSRLAAAPLGGAPSVPHVSARGHAGWTGWIAVVRMQKT